MVRLLLDVNCGAETCGDCPFDELSDEGRVCAQFGRSLDRFRIPACLAAERAASAPPLDPAPLLALLAGWRVSASASIGAGCAPGAQLAICAESLAAALRAAGIEVSK